MTRSFWRALERIERAQTRAWERFLCESVGRHDYRDGVCRDCDAKET